MSASAVAGSPLMSFQDALSYLPPKPVQEFARKHTIYAADQAGSHLYMVRSGRVVLSNSFDGNSPTVTRIVGPGGLFGEAALVNGAPATETASALDTTRVVSWTRAEIEQQIGRSPRLGMALQAYFAQRCIELLTRIEALAFRKTKERVMLALVQLAEGLGMPAEGGLRLAPMTHQMIAEYVGTSREIVTSHMSEVRRMGLLEYNRKYIQVDVRGMREALRQEGIDLPRIELPRARMAY